MRPSTSIYNYLARVCFPSNDSRCAKLLDPQEAGAQVLFLRKIPETRRHAQETLSKPNTHPRQLAKIRTKKELDLRSKLLTPSDEIEKALTPKHSKIIRGTRKSIQDRKPNTHPRKLANIKAKKLIEDNRKRGGRIFGRVHTDIGRLDKPWDKKERRERDKAMLKTAIVVNNIH